MSAQPAWHPPAFAQHHAYQQPIPSQQQSQYFHQGYQQQPLYYQPYYSQPYQQGYYNAPNPQQYSQQPPPPPPPPPSLSMPQQHQHQHQQQQQQQPPPRQKSSKEQRASKRSGVNLSVARACGQSDGGVVAPTMGDGSATDSLWYCEPCDKEFTQLGAFTAHVATHEKCQHAGCSFSGTRKVVSAHFLSSHGIFSGTGYTTIDVEGQQFRVLMGTSPEEVQQWRADRRKQFPTAANVQFKGEHMEELRAAGGIVAVKTEARGKRKRQQEKPSSANIAGGGGGGGGANSDKVKGPGNKLNLPMALGKQGSLMKKLLEDEMTAEENVILQIFHFLVARPR